MKANRNNFQPIKHFMRLVSVTCIALAIHGCSSTEADSDKEQAMTPEQQQQYMLEKIESWSAAEPDIQRVLALEADMQLIVNQLASMAELDDDPLGSTQETENINNKPNNGKAVEQAQSSNSGNVSGGNSTVAKSIDGSSIAGKNVAEMENKSSSNNQRSDSLSHKMINNVKPSSVSSGHYFPKIGLHIAMFKDLNTVPRGWQYLQTILPIDLINKKPLLAKINYENTEYYSLRVGPLNSANLAKKICLTLQQKQHYCSVVEYKGLSFN